MFGEGWISVIPFAILPPPTPVHHLQTPQQWDLGWFLPSSYCLRTKFRRRSYGWKYLTWYDDDKYPLESCQQQSFDAFFNHFFLKLKKVQARNRTCCVFKIPDPDSSSWWFRDSLGYTHPLHILSPRTPVSQETRSSSDHQNVKSRRETRESKINFNPTKFEEAIKSLSNQIDGVLAAAWLRQLLGGSAYRSYVGFTTLSTKKIPALASVNRSTYKMVAKIRAVVMQAKAHYCIGLIAVTTITQEVTFINY